jgi:ADP-heptose:LPS heptosyltransferase
MTAVQGSLNTQTPGLKAPDGADYPKGRPNMRGRYLIRNPRTVAAMTLADGLLDALPFQRGPIPADPRRILVCNWAHLGDVLLTLPAIGWVRRRYPNAEIGLLTGSWAAPLVDDIRDQFARVHYIDHFNLIRSGALGARLKRHRQTAQAAIPEIRAAGYDLAIDFYPFFPSAAFTLWRAGIPARVGWTSGGLSAFHTHRVDRVDADRHAIDYQRDILARLAPDAPPAFGDLRPAYPRATPRGPLPAPLDDGAPYVLIHTGTGQPAREWPPERWTELARRLTEEGRRVVMIGHGAREAARNAAITAAVPGMINLTGAVDWGGLVDIVAGCDGLYGLESVASHIAAVFDKPVTVVFGGMTNPRQWGPMTAQARIVTFPTPCAPCNSAGCGKMYCIAGVQVEDVLSATPRGH